LLSSIVLLQITITVFPNFCFGSIPDNDSVTVPLFYPKLHEALFLIIGFFRSPVGKVLSHLVYVNGTIDDRCGSVRSDELSGHASTQRAAKRLLGSPVVFFF